ncbi:MAG: hypothetical protein NTX66_04470 [Candidatus Falkowbacteria bacterium]|nr:hypothetical protein [Candidatus Falkowbacteria bacterium]
MSKFTKPIKISDCLGILSYDWQIRKAFWLGTAGSLPTRPALMSGSHRMFICLDKKLAKRVAATLDGADIIHGFFLIHIKSSSAFVLEEFLPRYDAGIAIHVLSEEEFDELSQIKNKRKKPFYWQKKTVE